jgi:hypothetical protein
MPADRRTGSFPLKDLAEDFGLPYGDVLLAAHMISENRSERRMSRGRHDQCTAAMDRIRAALPAPRMFFDVLSPLVDAHMKAGPPPLPPTDPEDLRRLKFRGPVRYFDGAKGMARQEYEWPRNPRFGYAWARTDHKDKGSIVYTVDGADCPGIQEAVRRLGEPPADDCPSAILKRAFTDPQWALENQVGIFTTYGPFGGVKASYERAGNAWHGAVNIIAEEARAKGQTHDDIAWAYRAKDLGYEAPRMFYLFRTDRAKDQQLVCARGVRVRACGYLQTLEAKMIAAREQRPGALIGPPDVLDDDIDMAKAWTCITHILADPPAWIEGFIDRADDKPRRPYLSEELG